jgi:hypothetical protein
LGGNDHSVASLQPESQYIVQVSDSEIICEQPDGRTERIAWSDLQSVIVETNDLGPGAPDVFWVLVGSSPGSGCVIPQGATGEQALLDRLLKLPGYDSEAFIRAMSSTKNETFLCWKRP